MLLAVTYAIKAGKAYEVLVDMPLDRFLDALSRFGYQGVEPNIADPFKFDAKGFLKKVEDRGLSVAAISTGLAYTTYGYSLSSKNSERRLKAVDFMVRYCELAYEMGCSKVVIGLIRGRGGEQESIGLLKESIINVLDKTDHTGVTLVIEPLNRYETRILNTVDEVANIVREIRSVYRDRIAVLFDTFHASMEHRNPYEAYLRVKDLVRHVHVADSNRRPPGEGMIDWLKMLSLIKASGYRDFLSLECLPSPTFLDSIKKGAETLIPIINSLS